MPELVVRADATRATGAGHVMRCLALAEAWPGKTRVWGEATIEFVRNALRARQINVGVAEPVVSLDSILVVDTYDERERERGAAYDHAGARVLVDDVGCRIPHGYDAVWNPNAYGTKALYPAFRGPVYTGAAYTPVRRNVPQWTGGRSDDVAVTLGGAEIPEHIMTALEALPAERSRNFRMAGGSVPAGWATIETNRLWETAIECSRLLTAAGSTVWEAATAQIPVVVMLTAHNQRLVFEWARGGGVPAIDALTVRDPRDLTAQLIAALGRANALPAIPGDGAVNVAGRLAALVAD